MSRDEPASGPTPDDGSKPTGATDPAREPAAARPAEDVLDLAGSAPAVVAVIVAVAAVPPSATAVLAVAGQVLALIAGVPGAPRAATSSPEWGASLGTDGLVVAGPDAVILVDGPAAGPRRVQVLVEDRALMIAASAAGSAPDPKAPIGPGGIRVRLLEGASVVVDASFPVAAAPEDHLDADAIAARLEERERQAIAQMPADPFDDTAGIGALPGAAGLGQPIDATPAAGGPPDLAKALGDAAAAVAATGLAAAALRAASSGTGGSVEAAPTAPIPAAVPVSAGPAVAAWAPTHAIAPGGPTPYYARQDPAAPAGAVEAGVQVRLLVVDVGWAQVDASNGWSGWLDARALARLERQEPAPAAWSASHVVVGSGPAPARPQPDSSAETTPVAVGVPLRLLDLDRGWAHVDASNGWSGWLDARQLGLPR